MNGELKNKYDEQGKAQIALVRSQPLNANNEGCEEKDLLKMLYILNYRDNSGFIPIQIQTYSKDKEIQSLIVYGKNPNGLVEVRVHELGHRFYPHLTTVNGIHVGIEGLKQWQNNGGIENFLELLIEKGYIQDDQGETITS